MEVHQLLELLLVPQQQLLPQQLLPLLDPEQARHLCDDPTFPAGKPDMRIDHVFSGKDFVVRRCEVLRNPQTAVASDHLPIVAEIERAR